MAEPVLLNFKQHGNLRLRELRDFTKFRTMHLVPVVFHEFYGLATEFPLVFVRNSETGGFVPVALMGLSKGHNLYCQQPEWKSSFVPTTFTLAPLSVQRLPENEEEAVIAIDEESDLVSETTGEPMFTADGEYTEYLKARINHVVTVTRQSLQSAALCQWLTEKNLFRSKPLAFQLSRNATRYELEGVYSVDEEALAKLSDEEYLELRRRGVMPLIYSHLTSVHQFDRLLRLQTQADAEPLKTTG